MSFKLFDGNKFSDKKDTSNSGEVQQQFILEHRPTTCMLCTSVFHIVMFSMNRLPSLVEFSFSMALMTGAINARQRQIINR